MKILSILALLITVFLGFFHVVSADRSFTVIPKAAFTFADTFTSVDEVLVRHNGQSLAEKLRGDPQLDNLVRGLQSQKYIVVRPEEKPREPVKTPEPISKGTEVWAFAVFEPKPIFINTDAIALVKVEKTIGHHPGDILEIDAVKAQLRASLGGDFGAFESNIYGPAGLVSKVGDDIYGSACMAHNCPGHQGSFSVNTKTGAVVIGIQNERKVTVFGAVDMSHSPSSIQGWLKDIHEPN